MTSQGSNQRFLVDIFRIHQIVGHRPGDSKQISPMSLNKTGKGFFIACLASPKQLLIRYRKLIIR